MPSTVIARIDYRESLQELMIWFQSGALYCYFGVPPAEHKAFARAPSKGRFFSKHIRDRYPFERLS